jgi:hypothetical protein
MKRVSLILASASIFLAHCGATVSPRGDAASDATDATPPIRDVSVRDVAIVDTWIEGDTGGDTPLAEDTAPTHCGMYDPDTILAPTVLMPTQPFGIAAAVHGMAFSCGATPMLSTYGFLRYTLSACGGCDACDCIDPGYQASALSGPLVPGTYTAQVGIASRSFVVAQEGACYPVTSWPADRLRVEIVGPDRMVRVAGMPSLWWAHLTGTEDRCCGEPLVAGQLEMVRPAGADLSLGLYECSPDPCGCVGRPHMMESWVLLGEIAPGIHAMNVAGQLVRFEVPAS